MFKIIVLVIIFAVAFANSFKPLPLTRNIETRIVGGKNTTIESLPYQVSIHHNNIFRCSGTIISSEWVITTALCVIVDINKIWIRTGTNMQAKGGTKHKVDRIVKHPDFNWQSKGYTPDIGLLHVKDPFPSDSTRKSIILFEANQQSNPGSAAIISGWGGDVNNYSPFLQSVEVIITSKDKCESAIVDTKSTICVSYSGNNTDTCHGDKGGPLTINQRLAGIIPSKSFCGSKDGPKPYHEIAYYRSWIHNVTGV